MHKYFMPTNYRCINCKLVFKINHKGVCHARLVACSCSQVPKVDFSKSYSLVMNETIFKILLLMVIRFVFSAKIIYIETAFLYGDLENEISTECPQGMKEIRKEDCIVLDKCIYCHIQTTRQYYRKATKI